MSDQPALAWWQKPSWLWWIDPASPTWVIVGWWLARFLLYAGLVILATDGIMAAVR